MIVQIGGCYWPKFALFAAVQSVLALESMSPLLRCSSLPVLVLPIPVVTTATFFASTSEQAVAEQFASPVH